VLLASVSSCTQSCHPGGAGGQEGSGCQPGGGTKPSGTGGQPGGGLRRYANEAIPLMRGWDNGSGAEAAGNRAEIPVK
jgi:hypothetical protein